MMAVQYFFGPTTRSFAEQNLRGPLERGECLVFENDGASACREDDSWESFVARLADGRQPDFLVLSLPYQSIPRAIWDAQVPIVGLASDWNLQWHHYRYALPRCDLVFTDFLGVSTFTRAGMPHVRPGRLFGCAQRDGQAAFPSGPRPIDVLFFGNTQAAIHRDREPWLCGLAQLAAKWNVQIAGGVSREKHQDLLQRARISFNRSVRGEFNAEAAAALAAGVLLFQEKQNLEVPSLLRDREECVLYEEENLEELLSYYLEHEEERSRIAQAGWQRAAELSFEQSWEHIVAAVRAELPALRKNLPNRRAEGRPASIVERMWQQLSAQTCGDVAFSSHLSEALKKSPNNSYLQNLHGVKTQLQDSSNLGATATAFQCAWIADLRNIMAGLNLTEVLFLMGRNDHAIEQARRTLKVLERMDTMPAQILECATLPTGVRLVSC